MIIRRAVGLIEEVTFQNHFLQRGRLVNAGLLPPVLSGQGLWRACPKGSMAGWPQEQRPSNSKIISYLEVGENPSSLG